MDLFQKCYDFEAADMGRAIGVYPFFKSMEHCFGPQAIYNGRRVIVICSNDYLGLTNDSRVKQAAKQATDRLGTGCTGSRLLNGNTIIHDQLEREFADFLGKEDALVFSTGFLTNYGVISCLAEKGSFIISDTENHGSIVAGCRGSRATTVKYHHNDMSDLKKVLGELPQDSAKLIVTDGVFSMSGDIVDLNELITIKKQFPGTYLYLDDAHGIGVLGDQGRGTANYFGLTEGVDLIMATLSKSFASIGGIVTGPRKIIDYIRHHSQGFILSAAIPPASAAAALKALEIMKTEPQIFDRLWQNTSYIHDGFRRLGLSYIESKMPIISIFVGDEGKAVQLVKALFERDVFATPVLYPAVPYGQAVIRTSFTASHTTEDLDKVLKAFGEVAPEFGILKSQTEVPKKFVHRARAWNFDALFNSKEV
ncbi:MAG: aminotransferase class I/II-fold pyridoxal phosphate-dependent enzyme [Deltaproteobacteria bacterium]|nr:aminotransferase class I/II-fold pyridoxal phosphate-dependent enzyme [Deltaproteobacteria bacterium]